MPMLSLMDWMFQNPSRIDGPNAREEMIAIQSRLRSADAETRRKIVKELSDNPTVKCIMVLYAVASTDADGSIRALADEAIRLAGVDREDIRKHIDEAKVG